MQPQRQVVDSGSWWMSVRGRCGGIGARLGWRFSVFAAGGPSFSISFSIAAISAAHVSSNSLI
jgi:hypothetical protein